MPIPWKYSWSSGKKFLQLDNCFTVGLFAQVGDNTSPAFTGDNGLPGYFLALPVIDMGQINGKAGFAFGTFEFVHEHLLLYYRRYGEEI
jgi:hypothetical protein